MKQEQPRHDLGKRTKDFALRIIRMYAALPKTTEAQVIGKQVLALRYFCRSTLPRSAKSQVGC